MRQVIRVFPRRTSFTPTDELAFIGDPPMMRPEASEVHVSCAFTWDVERAKRLAQAWGQYYPVKIGGPAFESPVNGFVPGQYIKEGVTFTSRGCNNQCPWCLVPSHEGKLTEYADFAQGNIIQDNNFLQCSRHHQERVFEMLKKERRGAEFVGGLEAGLVTDWFADQLRGMRIRRVFLAADTESRLKPLEQAVRRLSFLGRDKLQCYTLIGRNSTIEQDTARLVRVWELGLLPFAQLFQPSEKLISYSREWRDLQRTWSRPAATKSLMRQGERR